MVSKKSPVELPRSTGDSEKLGILTNPFARSANVVRLPRHPLEHITQTPAEVPRALDKLLDAGVTALAINGGDGTLGAAIAHMEKRGALLPIVPVMGGTNNAVAKDAGSLGTLEKVLARLDLQAPCRERSTLRVMRNGQPLGVGFIFSTGLIVRFTEAYYEGPWYGPPQAARVVAKKLAQVFLRRGDPSFWAFEPTRVHIDGRELPLGDGAQLSFLSTIDTQILFFKPFQVPAALLTGFNALVNALPSRAIARHLWPIARARYHGPGHWTQQAHDFAVTGTRKVFFDGELHAASSDDVFTVSPGPRVKFLQLRK